jgi:hypothetical protein
MRERSCKWEKSNDGGKECLDWEKRGEKGRHSRKDEIKRKSTRLVKKALLYVVVGIGSIPPRPILASLSFPNLEKIIEGEVGGGGSKLQRLQKNRLLLYIFFINKN